MWDFSCLSSVESQLFEFCRYIFQHLKAAAFSNETISNLMSYWRSRFPFLQDFVVVMHFL